MSLHGANKKKKKTAEGQLFKEEGAAPGAGK